MSYNLEDVAEGPCALGEAGPSIVEAQPVLGWLVSCWTSPGTKTPGIFLDHLAAPRQDERSPTILSLRSSAHSAFSASIRAVRQGAESARAMGKAYFEYSTVFGTITFVMPGPAQ
jgi:hypothetical protein